VPKLRLKTYRHSLSRCLRYRSDFLSWASTHWLILESMRSRREKSATKSRGELHLPSITHISDPVRYRERQVQRPPKRNAADHQLHPDVHYFVKHGYIKEGSTQFIPLLSPIKTGAADTWSMSLLGTVDFFRTVVGAAGLSEYLRPVHWIVSSTLDDVPVLVVMSPFEVNAFLPTTRKNGAVRLHVYTPRVIRSMRSFSDLSFHAVPALPDGWAPPARGLLTQVDLWAGGLYLDDYDTYMQLCAFLGLFSRDSAQLYGRADVPRQGDGFVRPRDRGHSDELGEVLEDFDGKSFVRSPVEALRRLINLRRHGMDFIRTHVGQILHGRPLGEEDFE
jgi:hypothetical protein